MNKLFLIIRKVANGQHLISESSYFKRIAKEANVSLKKLPFYLDRLEELGLIQYSMNEYIRLTPLGESQERLTQRFFLPVTRVQPRRIHFALSR